MKCVSLIKIKFLFTILLSIIFIQGILSSETELPKGMYSQKGYGKLEFIF
jgi:hypothetical protein